MYKLYTDNMSITSASSLSRRSAGLPEAVEAMLQCNNLHLTHDTVTKLLEAANIPYPEECTETEDLVQVHSLHMLRLVLSSAKLRHHLIPFSDQVRASFLLKNKCYFGLTVNKIFPTQVKPDQNKTG